MISRDDCGLSSVGLIPHAGGRKAWSRAGKFTRLGFRVILWRPYRGSTAVMTSAGLGPQDRSREHAHAVGEMRSAGDYWGGRRTLSHLRHGRGAAAARRMALPERFQDGKDETFNKLVRLWR